MWDRQSSFSKLSVTSRTSQLILQPFRRFIYVTVHSPALPLLHLRHSSFSNPSFASPMSQAFHLLHLASRPCLTHFGLVLQKGHQISESMNTAIYVIKSMCRLCDTILSHNTLVDLWIATSLREANCDISNCTMFQLLDCSFFAHTFLLQTLYVLQSFTDVSQILFELWFFFFFFVKGTYFQNLPPRTDFKF